MDSIERDELFEDAARIVVREQNASTSLLQRRLKLGYNRAGRIMDSLVDAKIVSGGIGSRREGGERVVLYKTEFALCKFLGIEHVAYSTSSGSVDDCITEKCTYPNCQCPPERLGIITAGELNRKGISNKWLRIWSEVQKFYGDVQKKETQEDFLRRMQREELGFGSVIEEIRKRDKLTGDFSVYYVEFPHYEWKRVSSGAEMRINEWYEEYKVINDLPCVKARVNGSSPFDVWIPIPSLKKHLIVDGKYLG